VGTDDGKATLTELETKQTLARIEEGEGVYSVALSGDGRLALIGTGAGTRADFKRGAAILWSLERKRQIGGQLLHEGRVSGVCFSPNGSLAVTASFDGIAKVWEVRTGKLVGEPLRHKNPIQAVAFSPDGKVIATASWDKTVQLWDASSFKAIGAPLQHRDLLWCVAFSPNGERIVTGSGYNVIGEDRGEVTVWDRNGAKLMSRQQNRLVSAVTFSASGEYIFAGVGNELRAWRSADGEAPVASLRQDGMINAVGVSANGRYVLFGGRDKSLTLGRIAE
jgi:WD40 repeat protein